MTRETNKTNLILIIIAIIGVCGTVVGAIITVMGNINVEKIRQEAELTKIALVTIATQGGATQMVLQSTANAPTSLPYPTYTPYPTPLLTPTNSKVFLFQDNFNEGPKPDWERVCGNWIMSNGEFSISQIDEINPTNSKDKWTYGTAFVGSPDWQDYKVSTQINLQDESGNCGSVLVRAQDAKNFLAWEFCIFYQFVGGRESIATWYIVQNGEWIEIPNTKTESFPSDKQFNIEVIVKGNVIQSFVNRELVNSFSGFPFTTGKAGVRIQSNSVSKTLSFDNFTIETDSP